jgi:hypothetical protein
VPAFFRIGDNRHFSGFMFKQAHGANAGAQAALAAEIGLDARRHGMSFANARMVSGLAFEQFRQKGGNFRERDKHGKFYRSFSNTLFFLWRYTSGQR